MPRIQTDRLVGQSLPGQAQHVQLAFAERLHLLGRGRGSAGRHLRDDPAGDRGIQHLAPGRRGLDRAHQVIGIGALEEIAVRTRAQQGEDVGIILVRGQDQHAHVRERGLDLAGGLDAGDARHLDIEHRDVGMVLADEPERLPAVAGLGHDGDLGVFFQELADAFADDGVVVGKDDADGMRHGWLRTADG